MNAIRQSYLELVAQTRRLQRESFRAREQAGNLRLEAALERLARIKPSANVTTVCEQVLFSSLIVGCADMGNIQLRGPRDGQWRLVAEQHCPHPILIDDLESIRGSALRDGRSVFSEDVTYEFVFDDPASNQLLEKLIDAEIRALHLTPLLDSRQEVIGIISLYHRRPCIRREGIIDRMRVLGHAAARLIESRITNAR